MIALISKDDSFNFLKKKFYFFFCWDSLLDFPLRKSRIPPRKSDFFSLLLWWSKRSRILSLFWEEMFYRLVQKANPLDQAHKQRYATSVNAGKIDTRMIAKTLAQKSSLTTGDVMSVLENLMEKIPRWLGQGYSVSLGELGTFRLSLSSEGSKSRSPSIPGRSRRWKFRSLV